MIRLTLKSLLLVAVIVILLFPTHCLRGKPHNINDVPGAVKMITTLKSDSGKEIQVEYVKENDKWVPNKKKIIKWSE